MKIDNLLLVNGYLAQYASWFFYLIWLDCYGNCEWFPATNRNEVVEEAKVEWKSK